MKLGPVEDSKPDLEFFQAVAAAKTIQEERWRSLSARYMMTEYGAYSRAPTKQEFLYIVYDKQTD